MSGRSMFDLTDRVAVVTGAGGSLGRAIAVGLANAGADLALLDVRAAQLEVTADAVRTAGRRVIAVRTDVSSEAAVAGAFAAVDDAFGRVDIMVNNAAAPVERTVPEVFPLDAWQRSLAVNLTGYFLCARAAGARMVAAGRGGSVVNMSSIAGSSALGRGNFAYSVAKGGVNQLTRELAVEWAQHRIRVNAIQPVQFHNEAWDATLADPSKQGLVDHVLAGIPLGHMGNPDEIVGPVIFLVSDAAAMVTGAILPVDGGNLALNAGGSLRW
jgi:NAD(P)-dependent dehydrogenase (short-subunit alcohol dehydrogenase family)